MRQGGGLEKGLDGTKGGWKGGEKQGRRVYERREERWRVGRKGGRKVGEKPGKGGKAAEGSTPTMGRGGWVLAMRPGRSPWVPLDQHLRQQEGDGGGWRGFPHKQVRLRQHITC